MSFAKTKVREQYEGIVPCELIDKAYNLASTNFIHCQSCSQSVVIAFYDLLDIESILIRASTSFHCGHSGQSVGTCGALIGGTLVLDYCFGRQLEKMPHYKFIRENMKPLLLALEISKLLYDKYIDEYGTVLCPQIQTQVFGRSFYLLDWDESRKFENLGGYTDPDKTADVVGNAARWTMQILLEEGGIEQERSMPKKRRRSKLHHSLSTDYLKNH